MLKRALLLSTLATMLLALTAPGAASAATPISLTGAYLAFPDAHEAAGAVTVRLKENLPAQNIGLFATPHRLTVGDTVTPNWGGIGPAHVGRTGAHCYGGEPALEKPADAPKVGARWSVALVRNDRVLAVKRVSVHRWHGPQYNQAATDALGC